MNGGDAYPTTHSSSSKRPKRPGAVPGNDAKERWDPTKELGLINIASRQITCLGKTWDNNRCRRGPSANNNRPCRLQACSAIQSYIDRLTELPVAEVATRRADLLLDLAEAMMCLKEPDDDSDWKGHQPEQAAAQAYTWRRQLSLKANLIRVPSIIRSEAYAFDRSAPKRRREDDSPSPSKKRQASAADHDIEVLSQASITSQMFTNNAFDPTGSSPSPSPLGEGRVHTMPQLPPERLAHGIRILERRLQEEDAIIRNLELELRELRDVAERLRQGSSQSDESTHTLQP